MRRSWSLRASSLALAALVIPACGGGSGSDPAPVPVEVTDFHLVDKNPKSHTHGKSVSPRDYLGKVPAFYFTHAS